MVPKHYVSDLDRLQRGLAFLLCLLLSKGYDRVYRLREKQITASVIEAWEIGASCQQELQKLQEERNLDCASAMMKVVTSLVGDLRLSKVGQNC